MKVKFNGRHFENNDDFIGAMDNFLDVQMPTSAKMGSV